MTGDPLFGPDGTQLPARRVAEQPAATAGPVQRFDEPEAQLAEDRGGSDDLPDEAPTPPSGLAARQQWTPPSADAQPAARPDARPTFRDDEPSLFGLTRRSRSRLGSRLFTVVFVAIFLLIFLQLVTRLFTGG